MPTLRRSLQLPLPSLTTATSNGDVPAIAPPVSTTTYPTGPPGLTIEATEAAYAEIEAADLSDIEAAEFEGPKVAWTTISAKRMIEIEQKELGKRKV
jgi:DNA helicase INO80